MEAKASSHEESHERNICIYSEGFYVPTMLSLTHQKSYST